MQVFLHLTQPSRHSIVFSTATVLTHSEADLIAEKALLLQQQIILHRQVKKPAFLQSDRLWLVLLASRVKNWKESLHDRQARHPPPLVSSRFPPLLEIQIA